MSRWAGWYVLFSFEFLVFRERVGRALISE